MPVETGGSSSLPLPSGASTLAEQQTQTTHLSQIETASETVATTVATAANQTTTNTRLQEIEDRVQTLEGYTDGLEGKLDSLIAKFTDGTVDNNIGSAVSKTVKSGSGRLLGFTVRHADASALYFWLFNNTAASGTQLLIPFLVPAASQVFIGTDLLTTEGVAFSTGLTYGLSTSGSSYSAYGTAANVFVSTVYS